MFRFAPQSEVGNKKSARMITDEAFVLVLDASLVSLVLWAVKRLPEQRWQFLASVPVIKDSSVTSGFRLSDYGHGCDFVCRRDELPGTPGHHQLPDLFAGMAALWQPIILLILQVLWGSVFVLFGKSMVTSVEIHFRLTKSASS